jgi:diadenosine tetraphosphate (Ap4A) HIT family hydrolase
MRRLLLKLARQPLVGALLGYAFAYLSSILPLKRVGASRYTVAFHHPAPSWATHLLFVPKRRIRTLIALAQVAHIDLFADLLLTAEAVARSLALDGQPYVLCANGGPRQEVQQVHFHLFTGDRYALPLTIRPQHFVYEDAGVIIAHHPSPSWELHLVVQARGRPDLRSQLRGLAPGLLSVIADAALVERGYTLLVQHEETHSPAPLTLHLIAGARRTP